MAAATALMVSPCACSWHAILDSKLPASKTLSRSEAVLCFVSRNRSNAQRHQQHGIVFAGQRRLEQGWDYCFLMRTAGRKVRGVVAMAPDEEKMTRRSPLDFPVEWDRPSPGRRPDIFPQFSPMKTPLPPPLPADPPEEDEEEEEKKEEDPEKEDKPEE